MKLKSIRNKRGSHVGVVVSFVIFVTFLTFLYSIIQPATVKEKDKDYVLEYLTFNLLENSSDEMTTMVVKVLEPVTTCINLQNILTTDDPPEEGEIPESMLNHLSFSTEGENFYYEKSGQGILVDTGPFEGIITISISEDIDGLISDKIVGCNPHPYTIGYIKTFSELFATKMFELNDTYYADYEKLKAFLGLPEGTEFSFYIFNSDRSVIIISAEITPPPTDRSVFVQETPIQYIDKEGNELFGFLLLKVW